MGAGGSSTYSESKLHKIRGKVEDWVEVLDNELEQDDMQVVCLEFLSKLMKRYGDAACDFMHNCKGIFRVADSMKTYPSNEIVLRAAADLLIHCHRHEALSEDSRMAGIREILLDALERHQMDEYIPKDANEALRLLYKTGTVVGIKSIMASLETSDYARIVNVLRDHSLKNKVQQEGFAALARIFEASPGELE